MKTRVEVGQSTVDVSFKKADHGEVEALRDTVNTLPNVQGVNLTRYDTGHFRMLVRFDLREQDIYVKAAAGYIRSFVKELKSDG